MTVILFFTKIKKSVILLLTEIIHRLKHELSFMSDNSAVTVMVYNINRE